MSDTKIISFPENGNNGNGFDPNFLYGAMMSGGGFGGFGGGNWLLPFLLFALWGGNGFGGWGNNGNNIAEQLNNNAGRDLIMQAVQGNNNAISQLASTLNCSVGEIRNAIYSLSGKICEVGNQVGLSSMQVINAITSGNASLQNQLASCCCDLKQLISESNYLTERGFCNTNQILAKGFSDLGYATAQQTCDISKSIEASTSRILEGQRAAEMREMQREITERDRRIAEQATAINNYQQTQTFGAMITQATAPIAAAVNNLQSDVDGIKCRLPRTEVIPAQPDYVPINRSINVPYGLYCGLGFNGLFANNCTNGSLWG